MNDEMREADVVLESRRMGALWPTRLSFARQLVARLRRERWRIGAVQWELDRDGCGEAIYRVDAGSHTFHFVIFSTVLDPAERTDRVIAERWDAAAALCEGELTAERLAHFRANVPKQEYGRADHQTLSWTRGNRSGRFFDHVVACLADGQQPDMDLLAQGGYIFRSTAYYANGKFGLTAYEAIAPDHPLAGSYMAQMLAAYLFREFAVDLAEHVARCRNPQAARLHPDIRRYLGIGNATGLGLVPFVLNNPQLTHAWCWVRETAVSHAQTTIPTAADRDRLLHLLDRCHRYFGEDQTETKGLFTDQATLQRDLAWLRQQVAQQPLDQPWQTVCAQAAGRVDVESEELLNTLLIELYPAMADGLVANLEMPPLAPLQPEMSLATLRALVERDYGWALRLDLRDPAAKHFFWYFSADSEEPLLGVRGEEAGEGVERPLNIPHQIQSLIHDLANVPAGETVAFFLLQQPQHRLIIQRVQALDGLAYAEPRSNIMDAGFIPLYLQRFQLAMYGMERYSPQSVNWVRVTLMQGAPTVQDLAAEVNLDASREGNWAFPLKPEF